MTEKSRRQPDKDEMEMDNNKNKQEQKNKVVEAMLRAREKEMQQEPTEEKLPTLSPDEYEEMYRKILGRLKAEGLLDDESVDKRREKTSGGDETAATREVSMVTGRAESAKKDSKVVFHLGGNMERAGERQAEGQPKASPVSGQKASGYTEHSAEGASGKTGETRGASKHTGTKKIRWFRKKAVKAAGICLVAGAAVFGLSMTSEANRLLLMQTANEVLGTGDLMQVDNGDDRDLSVGSEDEARQNITDALNAEVPEFLYLPEGMKYESCEIIEDAGFAKIEYSCANGYLYLNISNSLTDMSQSGIKKITTEEIETLNGKIVFVIKQIDEEQFSAAWEYKNVSYTLSGKISREELIKILEKISFSM